MPEEDTKVDRLLKYAKNNWLIALVVVACIAVVALSNVLTAIKSAWNAWGGDELGLEIVTSRLIADPSQIEQFKRQWLDSQSPKVDSRMPATMPPAIGYGFPLLDIIAKNDGKTPVVLTNLQLEVHQTERTSSSDILACSPSAVSWVYNVLLNDVPTQTKEVLLAQSLAPNAIDRFVVILGYTLNDVSSYVETVYEVKPVLLSGKDKTELETLRFKASTLCSEETQPLLEPYKIALVTTSPSP